MHGVVFTSFRDYVTSAHGPQFARAVLDAEPVYLLSETYDDARLVALIERTAERSGRTVDEETHDFGVFTAQTTFSRLYPAFFSVASGARDFLLTVETRIHELVRATIPHARPPQLHVDEAGPDAVDIHYTSPRRLCVLLRGLAEGTARAFGETTEIEETTCMRKGDDACRFRIRLNGAAVPTA